MIRPSHTLGRILPLLALLCAPSLALAETPADSGAAGGLENTKDYKETQDVINKTQAKIDQLKRDNDARAKEIEAIANRVGDVITTMSSQGSDNTSLRSEMAKLSGQLDLERETTKGLRAELAELKKQSGAAREKELEDKLRAAQDANRETEKRLSAALETIAGHAKTNRQLVADVESLKKELEAARKENDLIRRLRSSNPSQPLSR
jgi:chromosome segregation ATPase